MFNNSRVKILSSNATRMFGGCLIYEWLLVEMFYFYVFDFCINFVGFYDSVSCECDYKIICLDIEIIKHQDEFIKGESLID